MWTVFLIIFFVVPSTTRKFSTRASPVGSFDFEFAELTFQRVVNESAVGAASIVVAEGAQFSRRDEM